MSADYDAIKREYETTQKSVRELARQFGGVTHQAINKKMRSDANKGEPWIRRVAAQIAARVQEKLALDDVEGTDRAAIEEAAQRHVDVMRSWRAQVRKQASMVERLSAMAEKRLNDIEQLVPSDNLIERGLDIIEALGKASERLMKMDRELIGLGGGEGQNDPEVEGALKRAKTNEQRAADLFERLGRRAGPAS